MYPSSLLYPSIPSHFIPIHIHSLLYLFISSLFYTYSYRRFSFLYSSSHSTPHFHSFILSTLPFPTSPLSPTPPPNSRSYRVTPLFASLSSTEIATSYGLRFFKLLLSRKDYAFLCSFLEVLIHLFRTQNGRKSNSRTPIRLRNCWGLWNCVIDLECEPGVGGRSRRKAQNT